MSGCTFKTILSVGALLGITACVGNGSSPSSSSLSGTSSSSVSSISSSSSGNNVHSTCPSEASNAFEQYARNVPGTIEAESFDPSGFLDSSTGNEGGAFRTDVDVDIKAISGGYAIGWMRADEWIEYTINVEAEANYDLTVRAGALESGRTLRITQCGTILVNSISVPTVSAWGEFKTVSAGKIRLTKGLQKIRVSVTGSNDLDLDWIHIGPYTGQVEPAPVDPVPVNPMPGKTCDLPNSLSWTSGQPLISPKSGNQSVKDPTIVQYDGKYHVFATVYNSAYKSIYMNFTDLAQAGSAAHSNFAPGGSSTVAPQVFYFTPHKKWYIITQWAGKYSTNSDINNPNGWAAPKPLLSGEPSDSLDFWVICNDTHCYLFFSRDDGKLYMSKTTIGNFPNFSGYTIAMSDQKNLLFEASNVYKVQGTNKYLLLVEAWDSGPRFFRSWTSTSLDGPWTPYLDKEATPFAGARNITFNGEKWTNDISHGELVRSGFDEKLEINACKMQFLYQGYTPPWNGAYNDTPYKLGLLTAK